MPELGICDKAYMKLLSIAYIKIFFVGRSFTINANDVLSNPMDSGSADTLPIDTFTSLRVCMTMPTPLI